MTDGPEPTPAGPADRASEATPREPAAGAERPVVAPPEPIGVERSNRPSAPSRTAPPKFSLTPAWSIVLAALVVAITLWSEHARDPDFPLPNPFAGLTIGAIAVFLATGFVRGAFLRMLLRVGLAIAPLGVVLSMEVWLAARDARDSRNRILQTDDILLRYHYRPGAEGINHLGLWDDEHAIPAPPDVFRIVVLGDSVPNDPTIQRTERFHRVLERELTARHTTSERIEVINVSCEGYNTIQEVRLLEQIGLRYEPDLVVLAYVLNDPFLQNGGYRRIGNSFFAFRFAPMVLLARDRSFCPFFEEMNRGYAYELVVRSSLERLRLLSEIHHFGVVVAALPIVERFDDATCIAAYDRVGAIAQEQGFGFLRVVDAFEGEDFEDYLKPSRFDVTHPNARGHVRIGTWLADRLAESGRIGSRPPLP